MTYTTTTTLTGQRLIDAKAEETYDPTSDAYAVLGSFVHEMRLELDTIAAFRDSFRDEGVTAEVWATANLATAIQQRLLDFAARATGQAARHSHSINITRDHQLRELTR